jgi:hypothetical protein
MKRILFAITLVAIVSAAFLGTQAMMKSMNKLANNGEFVLYCSIDSIFATEFRGTETKAQYIELSTEVPLFEGPRPCEVRFMWQGIIWDASGIIRHNGNRTELEIHKIYRLVSPAE